MKNSSKITILVLIVAIIFTVYDVLKFPFFFSELYSIVLNPINNKHNPVKLEKIKRYNESISENFSPKECKQLLEEWQPYIDDLEFTSMSIADQTFLNISGGRRTITFIYRNGNIFEGCNILDAYKINLDEKESEIEKYFNCKKENCKDYKFENGRFLYVYNTSDKYNILKYMLRVKGKAGIENPSLTFQIFYIQKNMSSFIQHKINRAKQGYGCG